MELTIREALTFGGLIGARIMAGAEKLDNKIKNITVIEVTESSIADWILAKQLCITTCYAIKDDIEQQKRLIRILHEKGCSGLLLCHVGIWIKEISPEIIALCDELKFPLIFPRTDATYVEIMNPIIIYLMENDHQNEAVKYADIRGDLIDLIINEDDFSSVFQKMAKKLNRSISMFDIYCNCIYSNKSKETVEKEASYIKYNFNLIHVKLSQNKHTIIQKDHMHSILSLVRSQQSLLGFILIDCDEKENDDVVIKVADMLNSICMLMFSRKSKIMDVREHYLQEYIADLLVWNFRSGDIAVKRGLNVGINISNKNILMVININELQQEQDKEKNENLMKQINQSIITYIKDVVSFNNRDNAVILRSDTIIVLLNESRDELKNVQKIAERCIALFEHSGTTVSVGISEWFDGIEQIPIAYNQATRAAILGRKYYGNDQVLTYADVWFFHHLHNLRNNSAAKEISGNLLEPLRSYDEAQNTSLVETLYALIYNNKDLGELSQDMYLHRNTLLHRKNKIIEILGYSPFEMPHLLNFIFALEIVEK